MPIDEWMDKWKGETADAWWTRISTPVRAWIGSPREFTLYEGRGDPAWLKEIGD
jgi:hypothetical protein